MQKWTLLLLVVCNAFGWSSDNDWLQVDYSRQDGGYYDVNADYALGETYQIYAIQRFPEADSIVGYPDYDFYEDHPVQNQTLVFTVENHAPQVDYYVLHIWRDFGEWREEYFIEFEDGQMVLIHDSNDYDTYFPNGIDYSQQPWVGELGEYCTPEIGYDDDGELDYVMVELNWATRLHDELDFPLLDAVALDPTTLCALWDDTLATETGYKLLYKKWNHATQEWAAESAITLPANMSGYCINGVDPSSLYLLKCYPLGVSDADTLINMVQTFDLQDPSEMDYLHHLPCGQVSSIGSHNGLLAYAFVYGWQHDAFTHYYDYLLIKRENGSFTLTELYRSDDPNHVFITDVAVSDHSVYVSHTLNSILKIDLPDDATIVKQNLSCDFQGGFVKDMESRNGNIYMAIKYRDYILGGDRPCLGILNPDTDQITLHTHPDIASGCDIVAAGETMIYLAENFIDHSGNAYNSRVVYFRPNGDAELPIAPLPHLSAQSGITDMAVNPVTAELVYFSPVYGLWGNYNNDYNNELVLPAGFSGSTPINIHFNDSGVLFMTHQNKLSVASTPDAYQTITTASLPTWTEQTFDNTDLGIRGLVAASVLTLPSPDDLLLIGAALVFTEIAAISASSLHDLEFYYPDYYLGSASYYFNKETVVKEAVETYRVGSLRWLLRHCDFLMEDDPEPKDDPKPFPVPWPQPKTHPPRLSEKQCQIDDPAFTSAFYSFDQYYNMVTSGTPPFDAITCANRECIGAHFSKFILVELKTSSTPKTYQCYVTHPLTFENMNSISMPSVQQLFQSEPDCYSTTIHTGWISYGPWRRWDPVSPHETPYFYMTDSDWGPEPFGKQTEFMDFELYMKMDTFIKSKPYLSWNQFYVATTNPMPEHGTNTFHPNMPESSELFRDGSVTLKGLDRGQWITDSFKRIISIYQYFKDPALRREVEYEFDPVSARLVHAVSETPLNTLAFYNAVMACNEQLFAYEPIAAEFDPTPIYTHGQLLGGAAALWAGTIVALDGKPMQITNNSGHYRPGKLYMDNVAQVFAKNGWPEISRKATLGSPFITIYFNDRQSHIQSESYCHFGATGTSMAKTATTQGTENATLVLTTRLFDAQDSTFATDLQIRTSDNTVIEPTEVTADHFASFELFFSSLKESGFHFQGQIGTDPVYAWPDVQTYEYPAAGQDTLTIVKDYLRLILDPGISAQDQSICIFKQGPETYGESEVGRRYNVLTQIVAENDLSGTLQFAYTHREELDPDERTGIFYRNETTGWSELSSSFDDTGTLLEAHISQSGTFAMFVVPDESGDMQNTRISVRALLEGAFDSTTGAMSTALVNGNTLPYASPYDESYAGFEGLPDSLVDWVYLELSSDPDNTPVWQSSMFIGKNGWLCTPNGDEWFVPDIPPGDYWLQVHHRNHLSVCSSAPLALRSEGSVHYSFTESGDRYAPDTPAVQSPSGEWCLIGGDIDGDGSVTTRDYVRIYNQILLETKPPYLSADVNMDGSVDAQDMSIWRENARKGLRNTSP